MRQSISIIGRNILWVIIPVMLTISMFHCAGKSDPIRKVESFDKNWTFHLGDLDKAQESEFDDSGWRKLDLPHDWSIEGEFSKDNPAGAGGGALPGGVGWYRKRFTVPESDKGKLVFIDFDGVYRNSEVWVNGHFLGRRPYGYSSFRYEMTPYIQHGSKGNIIAVRVDNSKQPNSRWYSGSGIYRHVRLVTAERVFVDHWGTFITTPEVSQTSAKVSIQSQIRNTTDTDQPVTLKIAVFDPKGRRVSEVQATLDAPKDSVAVFNQEIQIPDPVLWSVENPALYREVSTVETGGRVSDRHELAFGIRTFTFDVNKGFILNGKQVKINGVCNHHDLGCLGAAVNTRAMERQLEILKKMGCNGIRTSHNPPAPELLKLCDRMGFIVMDEAFDMWRKGKNPYDYSLDFDAWHRRDLEDMVLRDRNHPCVFIWSIGNEVVEQWDRKDSSGIVIARELASIIRSLDSTRPITSNLNDPVPENPVIRSEALDLIGFSYSHNKFADFPKTYPAKKFIGSETVSSLMTRGCYDMPSDSIRRWPTRWDLPLKEGNPDFTCSAYDNCSAPWGSTNEETWRIVKAHDFLSGQYIWTGFDYLGEPTPYGWPARSSYFGIVDLAGFPKDAYYLYQSEWTDKPVLHLFPHWNWKPGQAVDLKVFTNYEDVELFLNGRSLGSKHKSPTDLHLTWRVPFEPGIVKAVASKPGRKSLVQEIRTAGEPAVIEMTADRDRITADGLDLSFITVRILDENGTLVPRADSVIQFEVTYDGILAGTDNGDPTNHESFQSSTRKAFNGLCLAVVESTEKAGSIKIKAFSGELKPAEIIVRTVLKSDH